MGIYKNLKLREELALKELEAGERIAVIKEDIKIQDLENKIEDLYEMKELKEEKLIDEIIHHRNYKASIKLCETGAVSDEVIISSMEISKEELDKIKEELN